MSIRAKSLLTGSILAASITLAGCESDGPLEQLGENADRAIDKAEDAITGKGPMERAGEQLDEAIKRTGEQAGNAMKRAGEQVEDATSG